MAVTAALPPHCFLPFAGKDKDTQMATTIEPRSADLSEHGLEARGRVHRNPTTALLYMHTLRGGWAPGRRYRRPHRAVAVGPVRRAGAGIRVADRLGLRQPAARGGAIRRAARQARRPSRGPRALRQDRKSTR